MDFVKNNKKIIFLDTNSDDKKEKISYIFINPIEEIIAFEEHELKKAFLKINELSQKYWLAGYIRYEAGYCFLPKSYDIKIKISKSKPLLWFGIYDEPELKQNICSQSIFKPCLFLNKKIDFQHYEQKISKIKDEIKKGNTYQVNFSFSNTLMAYGSEENLYFSLRERQKTAYSAFIRNEFDTILSFSPELFFKIDDKKIIVKPMKGTIPRSKNQEEDKILLQNALKDEKLKAENLMIVDLLRNDLGMIAKNGSVKVENLLEIETYSTLHQITSSVSAELQTLDFLKIFKALFPCGSITGAPKMETMKIIKNLEEDERGVYCGAIGYISPAGKSVFSVPIRILQKEKKNKWIYKVGGGIVWDSKAKNEWQETKIKTQFLKKNSAKKFSLIETMLFENKKISFKKEHLDRLMKSASFFGFKIDRKLIEAAIDNLTGKLILEDIKKSILRLEINKKGKFYIDKINFSEDTKKVRNIRISDIILDKTNFFLKHKTTYRPWYSKTKSLIEKKEIFDEIFINQDSEFCEGSRTNIFVEINGKLFTPPLSAGLLNGILRQNLINQGKCKVKKLYLKDLKNAKNIYLGNSVRGLVRVVVFQ